MTHPVEPGDTQARTRRDVLSKRTLSKRETDMDIWRTWLARLLGLACIALGIIGLFVGFSDKVWKLGPTGWFTGGTLLGVVAIILILDEYTEFRRRQS